MNVNVTVVSAQELRDFAYSVDLTETLKFADEKFTYDDVSMMFLV